MTMITTTDIPGICREAAGLSTLVGKRPRQSAFCKNSPSKGNRSLA